MRKAMLLLAVFGLVGSLWAADPIIGTRRLNLAKSKFVQGAPKEQTNTVRRAAPKEFTEIYREIDGDLIELTATDGSSNPEKFTFPKQGAINKFCCPWGIALP